MFKAFLIVALVLCINTNEVVEHDLSKDLRPLWNSIQCIINSEIVHATIKDFVGLVKHREWANLIVYIPEKYPTLKGEINRCLNGGAVQLGYNLDFLRCLAYFPYPYCVQYLPEDFVETLSQDKLVVEIFK